MTNELKITSGTLQCVYMVQRGKRIQPFVAPEGTACKLMTSDCVGKEMFEDETKSDLTCCSVLIYNVSL